MLSILTTSVEMTPHSAKSKEKKKVDKTVAQTPSTSDDPAAFAGTISEADVRAAMEKVKSEELPPSPEEKETFFMSQVGMGEQLCAQGPTYYIPAAMCFYRALRVYPSPVELIMIYQTTVPEPVFKVCILSFLHLFCSLSPEDRDGNDPVGRESTSLIGRS
ncbi:protein import receptor MAS20 [Artomyces pyxidatus]|uniref:Protein import receptor MAS20 n=1 Tax=Artomyces pyxidatus TaxID=48021 RepID=A0ACB8TJP4_9AGAM|nr:protein import receptor MAS20 [Artomyces pyxidatus]